LIAIQENFGSIQTELQAPANIATWADDCYDVYSAALATSEPTKKIFRSFGNFGRLNKYNF